MSGLNRSIFRRLLFSHLSILLLCLVTVGLATSWLVKDFMYETRRHQLVRQARQVNLALLEAPLDRSKSETELLAYLDKAFDARLWLFGPDGRIVATSGETEVYVGKSVAPAVVSRVLAGEDVVGPLDFPGLPEPVLSVVVPWGKGDQLKGGLILHAPVQGLNQAVGKVRETILWATVVAMVLSTVAGSYLSWSISRPLKAMELVAAEIGNGRYDKRVPVQSPDEIGDLAGAINRMAGQLAAVERERVSLEAAREELFANISHELRTPLTAILGFLEALQDGYAENREQQQLYLTVAHREALHLKRMVEDLLDLARLTAKRVAIQRVPVDPVQAAREVCNQLQALAGNRRNQLRLNVSPAPMPQVLADPLRLRQILVNLVDNAIKFTEGGRITLAVKPQGEKVLFRVADTGVGIDEADLPMIWERFYKADRLRSRNRGGTGLGLAIVRELIDLHGGQIEVESRVGHGTVFTISLPACPTA